MPDSLNLHTGKSGEHSTNFGENLGLIMKDESLSEYVRNFRKRFGDKSHTCRTLASYEQGKINMEEAIEQIGTIYMSPKTIKEILMGLHRNNVFMLEDKNDREI